MNVLLIYPPSESFFIDTTHSTFGLSPPLGLLYIAKAIEDNNDQVKLIDFTAESFDEIKLINAIQKVDLVGITVLTHSLKKTIELIKLIKSKRPKLPIVIGGPHCTLFPKRSLEETGADISVQGDGETTLVKIINAMKSNRNFSSVPGICYRIEDSVKQNRSSYIVDDFDSISFPDRTLTKKYTYGKHVNPFVKSGEFTSMITSRGCPYACRFCSRNSLNATCRKRSVDSVIKELKEIKKQGYKFVVFSDDSFPSKGKRDLRIFEEIIKEGLDLKFYVNAVRVDSVDEKLLQKMKHAGVVFIQFGLESGNNDVLEFYNKHTSVEKIKKAVELSHKMGFITAGTFILGAPFETKEYFMKTISFAKSLPLDSVSFLPLRYMAGSDIWSEAVNAGNISSEEYIVEADSARGLSSLSREGILNYCKKAQQSYYLRPGFIYFLIVSSLKRDDFTFVQAYISLFLKKLIDYIKIPNFFKKKQKVDLFKR